MGCASSKTNRDYETPQALMQALRQSGCLEDLELIVGVDATKSNEMSGQQTFGGQCLHALNLAGRENPYQGTIKVATKFLERDMDAEIPLYFFGSHEANRTGGITFVKDCKGQRDLLSAYAEAIPRTTLSGPTTFVPLIKEACRRVRHSKKFHILLIITDGAIQDEKAHFKVLDEASHLPLAVVVVGVGDGPFGVMERFDDECGSGRVFDNLQFVSFNDVVKKESVEGMEDEFFFRAFSEIPLQYNAVKTKLGYSPPTQAPAPCPPLHHPFLQPQPIVQAPDQIVVGFVPVAGSPQQPPSLMAQPTMYFQPSLAYQPSMSVLQPQPSAPLALPVNAGFAPVASTEQKQAPPPY